MLRDDEIVEILKLVDLKVSKSELGAFFRKEDHPNYVECGDQILRNFLNGLVIHYRGTKENPKNPKETLPKPKSNSNSDLKKPNSTPPKRARVGSKSDDFKYKSKKKS